MPTSGHTTGPFTTLSTRRSWSLAEKRAILHEMAVPGAIVMEVARRYGISQSLLYRWRSDAAAAAISKPPPAFVPVAIEAPPGLRSTLPATRLATPAVGHLVSVIEIGLVCGRTVRATADVDAVALARIVAALEGSPEVGA
jgi:transposase